MKQEEFFFTIDVDSNLYAVKASNEESAKELLTQSLWIRQGEKQATIDRMKIIAKELA